MANGLRSGRRIGLADHAHRRDFGAIRKPFQLPPDQAARLRRLVAAARPVARPASGDPRAELYTLHISGMPSANIQGRTPRPLAALIRFLSGLMLAHCC